MSKCTSVFTGILLSFSVQAQTAPDITFYDIHGQEHNLYETLDEGKTVLLDFFFVDCVPCQEWTPTIEELYAEWGGGYADVVFWAFSDVDDNAYIQTFADAFGIEYTLAGLEGGAFDVIAAYAGLFPFLGYPTYSVICPDRSITWDIWPLSEGATEINDAIADCGATGVITADDGPDQEILIGCIYPNPASDEVFVPVTSSNARSVTIRILSPDGKIVRETQADTELQNIRIDDLQSGMYFVHITSGGTVVAIEKFLKL